MRKLRLREHGMATTALLVAAALWVVSPPVQAEDVSFDAYFRVSAKGLGEHPFLLHGLDDVGLFNGNLGLTIPIGPELHPDTEVSWQVALRYNSKIWSTDLRCQSATGYCPQRATIYYTPPGKGSLLGTRYVGLGWTLELGHIVEVEMPTSDSWFYLMTADGGEHRLWEDDQSPGTYYSRDGSSLKATKQGSEPFWWTVYFPNGREATYGAGLGSILDNYEESRDATGRDHARSLDGWYCTSMADKWGNRLEIQYHYSATFTDRLFSYQRSQVIPRSIKEYRAGNQFERGVAFDLDTTVPGKPNRIKTIRFVDNVADLTDPSASFLEYELEYMPSLDRLQLMSYVYEPPGMDPHTDYTYLLSAVRIDPDGEDATYSFSYHTCWDSGHACPPGSPGLIDCTQFNCSVLTGGQLNGLLWQVELPTGGRIRYDYDTYEFGYKDLSVREYPYFCEHIGVLDSIGPDSRVLSDGGGEVPYAECDNFIVSLGVSEREVYDSDGTTLLEGTTYVDSTSSPVNTFRLPVRLDSDPANPSVFFTTYLEREVVREKVMDGVNPSTGEPIYRSDRTQYLFSTGAYVIDGDDPDGAGLITLDDEAAYLPVEGQLVVERRFRGAAATPFRTTVHTFTSEELDAPDRSTRGRDIRPRATITYHSDDSVAGSERAEVVEYRYETDCDGSGCPDPAYMVNRTEVRRKDTFIPDDFDSSTSGIISLDGSSADNLYGILDSVVFDWTDAVAYWKGGTSDWLISQPSAQSLYQGAGAGSSPVERTVIEYATVGGAAGRLTTTRVQKSPGAAAVQPGDVETSFDYWTDLAHQGYGKVKRRKLLRYDDSSPPQPVVDRSELMDYQHGAVSRKWWECPDQSSRWLPERAGTCTDPFLPGPCDGWDASPQNPPAGLITPAELQLERTIEPALRRPTSVVDANADGVAAIGYDAVGRITSVDPTSSMAESALSYPSLNEVEVALRNAQGSMQTTARFEYDGLGRISLEAVRVPGTSSLGYVESEFRHKTYRYDGTGTVWRESDWLAHPCFGRGSDNPWCAGYQDAATLVARVDPLRRPEHVISSDGSEMVTTYSGSRRQEIRVGSGDGTGTLSSILRRTVTDLDSRGNTVRVLEDKDTSTTGEDLESPTTAQFVISSFEYDGKDRLTRVAVTGIGRSLTTLTQLRELAYDARGFLVSESLPELETGGPATDRVISYCRHDATGAPGRRAYGVPVGSLCAGTTQSDGVIDTHLDGAGRFLHRWGLVGAEWYRLAETTYGSAAPAIGKPIRRVQYNTVVASPELDAGSTGQQSCVDTQAVTVSHEYRYGGPQGLLDQRTTKVAFGGYGGLDNPAQLSIGYGYDIWGNVSRINYPNISGTNDCVTPPTISYTWGPMGLESIADGGMTILDVDQFDANTGMMTRWYTTVGQVGALAEVTNLFTPDGTRSRVGRIRATAAGTSVFDTGTYQYDEAGSVEGIPGIIGADWAYSYDDLGRVESATTTGYPVRSYGYDDFGNLTSLGGTTVNVDSSTNRLASTQDYQYDARGNMTHQRVAKNSMRRMRYSPENRLMALWSEGTSAPVDIYAFAYDQDGERLLRYRIEDDGGNGLVIEARLFLRDESGNVLTELLWAPDTLGNTHGQITRVADQVYLGRAPALRLETDAGARTYTALVTDHLQSIRAEVTDAGSTPSWTALDYWPFGGLVSNPGTMKTHHLFTAHEREYTGQLSGASSLEGLDYMHARYYSPVVNRFLSVDPVRAKKGGSQQYNRYAYALNNPIRNIDPDGLTTLVFIVDPAKGGQGRFGHAAMLVQTPQGRQGISTGTNTTFAHGIAPFVNRYIREGRSVRVYRVDVPPEVENAMIDTMIKRGRGHDAFNNCARAVGDVFRGSGQITPHSYPEGLIPTPSQLESTLLMARNAELVVEYEAENGEVSVDDITDNLKIDSFVLEVEPEYTEEFQKIAVPPDPDETEDEEQ